MSNRVLLLGAGLGYMDNIRAAKRAGYEVVATDQNPNAPGFSVADYGEVVDITDVDGTLETAKQYNVEGVIPMNDYGVRTAAIVSEKLGLVGVNTEVAKVCTDKAAMRQHWRQAGIPQPEFGIVLSEDEAWTVVDRVGLPVVTKPAQSVGGGSRGVSMVRDESDLTEAFEFAQNVYQDDRVLVEECVVGSEHSVEVIVVDAEASAIAVSDKEKTPPPARVDKSVIYPTSSSQRTAIERTAEQAVESLGITVGAAHVELAMTKRGPKLFELGARVGGGATADPIVRTLTGIDYFAQVTRLYAGERGLGFEPEYEEGVTYRFLTPSPGTLAEVRGIDEVAEWKGVLDVRVWVSSGDDISRVQVGSDRSGAIITHAETRAEAYELADKAESTLEFIYV